ncbi:reverse transcriptase domain-containing protein [Tanacetum coccineum]|uniref:Reverse transcriptase domain-containing protein n=1 Tax=Tanacetum coccineum TaxID=301880 RepID=A0ABQ5J8L3_9ASTR
MADQRTMAELLQAPTEGYRYAIVIPAILVENFELKHGLLNLDLLRACPHHGFTELHQLDTFYNALTPTDQDSLNAAAGGNLLTKTPRDALTIIENKSKVRNSRNKPIVSKVSTNAPSSSTPHSPEIAALVGRRKFHFPVDFVVVDYVIDPRVPLILERPFLRTARALIDVYGEELTLRVDDEAITFKIGQTSRYSYNDVVSINRIDVIDVACEEYAQEVLGFSDSSTSGNPTPS